MIMQKLILLLTTTLLLTAVAALPTVTQISESFPGNNDTVRCYTGTECDGNGDIMSMTQCCLSSKTATTYTSTQDGSCHECIVYGWLDESVMLRERFEPYKLKVGYLSGSGPKLTFRVIVDQGSTLHKADYTVNPQLITITSGSPSVVEVDTFLDGLALEEDELFTLRLELVGETTTGLLRPSLPVTLVDSDVLEVSMASADYRVSESNGTMTVVIKKDKRIATPLALRVSPHTIAQAIVWSDVSLPDIPTNSDPNSPNRARAGQDFDPQSMVVYFQADEDAPSNDLPVSLTIIDDNINEAPEEYFVVRLNKIEGTSSLVEVGERQVSLCRIVDNDYVRIGFTQPSYTITESQHYFTDVVKIAKEGVSEQSFYLLVEAVAASPSSSIAPASDKVAHNVLASNNRVIVQTLFSDVQESKVFLFVDPYLLPQQETVAFELVLSSEVKPFFLPAKNLYQSTYVIIEPSKL